MTPGTRVRFNERCPWPQRVGCEGIVVDPAIFKGKYPADARDPRRIIVLLDFDPLAADVHISNRITSWTCVTSASTLDQGLASGVE